MACQFILIMIVAMTFKVVLQYYDMILKVNESQVSLLKLSVMY